MGTRRFFFSKMEKPCSSECPGEIFACTEVMLPLLVAFQGIAIMMMLGLSIALVPSTVEIVEEMKPWTIDVPLDIEVPDLSTLPMLLALLLLHLAILAAITYLLLCKAKQVNSLNLPVQSVLCK